jgi:MFS family permease
MLTHAGGNAILSQVAYLLEIYFGVTAANAALAVSAIAIANTVGRIVCGTAADKLGQTRTVFYAQILSVVAFVGCGLSHSAAGFILFCMMAIFLYGGIGTLLPPLGGEIFGSHYMSENFTILYLVFPFGGISGPVISSLLVEATDSANLSMLICGAMAFVGMLLMIWVRRQLKKIEKPVAAQA